MTRPADEPVFAPPRRAQVAFRDDFSDPASGWDVGTFESGRYLSEFTGGRYQVTAKPDVFASFSAPGRAFSDLVAEVEVRRLRATRMRLPGSWSASSTARTMT